MLATAHVRHSTRLRGHHQQLSDGRHASPKIPRLRDEEITMVSREEEPPRPHPGTTTGSDERPAQRLAGALLLFDLPAELAQLQAESTWELGDRNAITLVKEGDLRI